MGDRDCGMTALLVRHTTPTMDSFDSLIQKGEDLYLPKHFDDYT
jgi:hypothetical protein